MAFTRNPSDTSVSPATYTADGASDLIIVDQQRDIAIDGSDGKDNIVISAAALASDALYNFDVRGFEGKDAITLDAALIQNSTINGNVGNDALTLGTSAIGPLTNFDGSYFLGGKGDDKVTAYDINGGEINGNIGNDIIAVSNIGASGFNQYIGGGQGNDLITVTGNFTDSIIDGNKGTDTITIEAGVHSGTSVNGGEGSDILRSSGVSKGLMLNGDLGNDTIAAIGGLGSTITGGEGKDTIVSFSAAGETSTIDAGVGADTVVTLSGGVVSTAKETIIFNQGDSVAATSTSFAGAAGIGNTLSNGNTIFFGNGVDTLTGVNTSDSIDIDFEASSLTRVNGANLTAVLEAGKLYEVTGAYASNKVFSTTSAANATDYLYVVGGQNLTLGQVFTNNTNIFVSSEELFLSDFS